jgi:hypothetical protein
MLGGDCLVLGRTMNEEAIRMSLDTFCMEKGCRGISEWVVLCSIRIFAAKVLQRF